MLPRSHPDRIQIAFDDHRLVNNAGLLLPATLAQHLGNAPGRANTGDKMLTLVASALAGGDCIGGRRCAACGPDLLGAGVHGQSAIHPGDAPAWGRSGAASGGARSANWTG